MDGRSHSLKELDLSNNPDLVELPSGMSVLTSLETLRCNGCSKLRSFVGIKSLTGLKRFEFGVELQAAERERAETGEGHGEQQLRRFVG